MPNTEIKYQNEKFSIAKAIYDLDKQVAYEELDEKWPNWFDTPIPLKRVYIMFAIKAIDALANLR